MDVINFAVGNTLCSVNLSICLLDFISLFGCASGYARLKNAVNLDAALHKN